jgi:hypothetical protein
MWNLLANHLVDVNFLCNDEIWKRVLRIRLPEYGYPLVDLWDRWVPYGNDGVNPDQFRIEMNSFLGKPDAFGLIRRAHRDKGQPLGIMIFFGLPSEGFEFVILTWPLRVKPRLDMDDVMPLRERNLEGLAKDWGEEKEER